MIFCWGPISKIPALGYRSVLCCVCVREPVGTSGCFTQEQGDKAVLGSFFRQRPGGLCTSGRILVLRKHRPISFENTPGCSSYPKLFMHHRVVLKGDCGSFCLSPAKLRRRMTVKISWQDFGTAVGAPVPVRNIGNNTPYVG